MDSECSEDDDKRLELEGNPFTCAVCEEATLDVGVLDVANTQNWSAECDGWYLHIHEFSGGEIPKSGVYAFCPDHQPDSSFPTKMQNPYFDPDVEVERLKEEYL